MCRCENWGHGALLQGRESEEHTRFGGRGAPKILDIDETGVTVKFQSQTLMVARYCARKQVEKKGVEEVEWSPMLSRPKLLGGERFGGQWE